jgi:hypothetical protein
MTDVAKLHRDSSGIYLIEVGPWFYYGRSASLYKRRSQHRRALERGIHPNPILQAAYNKYGQFSFEVVLECPKEDCPRQSVENFATGARCPQKHRSRHLGVLKVERFQ